MSDVQEALDRMQLGVNELRQKCKSHGEDCEICATHQQAIDTIRKAITTLAAERDELREDARHMYESYGAAQARAEAAEAKLAAAEADAQNLTAGLLGAFAALEMPVPEGVMPLLAKYAAIDAIAKEAS